MLKEKMNYQGQQVLVLGLGVSGRSAARYLIKRGAIVTGVDKNPELLLGNAEIRELKELGLMVLKESDPIAMERFALVVASPGVPSSNPVYAAAMEKNIELIGEIELACREISAPIVAVTGTNGKTTVCLLLGHIFNALGRRAHVLGNAGVPLTSEIEREDDLMIVCELSSYQLETMGQQVIDCAAILNITPDHLDRYPNMEAYAKAKLSIAKCLKQPGRLYVGERAAKEYPSLLKGIGHQTFGFDPASDVFCDTRSIYVKENIELILPDQYRGKSNHDVENIMAAYALCREMGIGPEDFLSALETFKKPPHRIEFVRSIGGISFYDDSKGTNLDAVICAVQSMPGNVVLIAGGVDKGWPFTPWIEAFGDKVKAVFAIGEAKKKLEKELSGHLPVRLSDSLENAVFQAFAIAEEGECVLLSPGCASFDMFKNYEHRGDRFKEIVRELDERGDKGK